MGFLVFVAVACVIIGGPLVWMAKQMRHRAGETKMMLIWHANSEQDKAITLGALRSAGISTHVVESGGYYRPEFGSVGFAGSQWEIWVPSRDEARAREALGLQGRCPS